MTVRINENGLAELRKFVTDSTRMNFRTVGRLERVLREAFIDTQQRAHIITGSLVRSGRTSSDFDGTHWDGTITYGGPSTGPNNPVDYAIYEIARGGTHDFLSGLPGFDERYERVLLDHLRSGGRL